MQKPYVSKGETCFLKKIFSLCTVIMLLIAIMLTVLTPVTAVTVDEASSYSKMISAGSDHCVVLKSDGTVYTWGGNGYGQLGDGTTTERNTPVQVSGLTGIVAISAGYSHCVALKGDGTVYTWGSNSGGMGDGTTTNRYAPVQVSGLTGVVAVAAGSSHCVALKGDGTVYTWGRNVEGQLGDGTITQRNTPIKVAALTLLLPSRTIIFEPTSGTVSPTSATTGIDGKLTNLPTPTRSGYTFIGWFTAVIGGTKITPDTIFTTDTRIYAQWEQTINPPTTDDTSPTTPPTNDNTNVDDKANSNQWLWIVVALIIVAVVVAVVIGLFVFKRTKNPNNNLTQQFTQ